MKTRLAVAALLLVPALAAGGTTVGSTQNRIGPPVIVAVDNTRAMACGRMAGEIGVLAKSVETLESRGSEDDSYSLAAFASDIYSRTTYIKSHAISCKCPDVIPIMGEIEVSLGKITAQYPALEKAPPLKNIGFGMSEISLGVTSAEVFSSTCNPDLGKGLPEAVRLPK